MIRYKELFESVIEPNRYVLILLEVLDSAFTELKNKEYKYPIQLLMGLNIPFKKYNIQFVLEYIPEETETQKIGINEMRTYAKTKRIEISCTNEILTGFQNTYREFKQAFKELIGHELIHRGKWKAVNEKNLEDLIILYRQAKEQASLLPTIERNKKEFSSTDETMSYAWQTIEELRFKGISDEQLIQYLRAEPLRLSLNSLVFDIYYNWFHESNSAEDKEVFKRYIKYIYDYLAGNLSRISDDDLLAVK